MGVDAGRRAADDPVDDWSARSLVDLSSQGAWLGADRTVQVAFMAAHGLQRPDWRFGLGARRGPDRAHLIGIAKVDVDSGRLLAALGP